MSLRRAAAVAGLAVCASCIYTADSSLPAHIRTVRIGAIANRSGYPGLDARLAAELARAFHVDGTLRPVASGGDAVLAVSVVAVRRGVVQEDVYDDVVTGRVVVTASVSLEDRSSGKNLLDRTVVSSAETQPAAGLYRLRRGETETEARASAVSELAWNIVRRVVEVW